MANRVDVDIFIYHEDILALKKFYDDLLKWSKSPTDSNSQWIGHIINNSKIGSTNPQRDDYIFCNATVELILFSPEKKRIEINTVYDWNPNFEVWIKLKEKYIPEAEIKYEAWYSEDCSRVTNVKELTSLYYLDADYEGGYFVEPWNYLYVPEVIAVSLLKEILKTDCSDIKKLEEMAAGCDDVYAFGKWEYIEIDEYQ